MATIALAPPEKYNDAVDLFGVHMHDLVGCHLGRLQEYAFDYPGDASIAIETLDSLVDGTHGTSLPSVEPDCGEWATSMMSLIRWWT